MSRCRVKESKSPRCSSLFQARPSKTSIVKFESNLNEEQRADRLADLTD